MGQQQSVPLTTMQMKSADDGKITGVNINSTASVKENLSTPSVDDNDTDKHNFGQPIRPPHHSSTSAINDCKSGASKQYTDCRAEQRASLACIEENYQNKNQACGEYFEAYKKCRREEHERKLEANARSSAWWRAIFIYYNTNKRIASAAWNT